MMIFKYLRIRSILCLAGSVLLCSCASTGTTKEQVTVVAYPPAVSSGVSFFFKGMSRQVIVKDNDGGHYTYRFPAVTHDQDIYSADAKSCGGIAIKACAVAPHFQPKNLEDLPCSLYESFSACLKERGYDDIQVLKEYPENYIYSVRYKQLGCQAEAKKPVTSFKDFKGDVIACGDSTGRQVGPVSSETGKRIDFILVERATFMSIKDYCKAMKVCMEGKGYDLDEK